MTFTFLMLSKWLLLMLMMKYLKKKDSETMMTIKYEGSRFFEMGLIASA